MTFKGRGVPFSKMGHQGNLGGKKFGTIGTHELLARAWLTRGRMDGTYVLESC